VRYVRRHHGRVASAVVRCALAAGYMVVLGAEAAKWLVGHRRQMRAERIGMYARVLRALATATATATAEGDTPSRSTRVAS